jgi:hypothetical protein
MFLKINPNCDNCSFVVQKCFFSLRAKDPDFEIPRNKREKPFLLLFDIIAKISCSTWGKNQRSLISPSITQIVFLFSTIFFLKSIFRVKYSNSAMCGGFGGYYGANAEAKFFHAPVEVNFHPKTIFLL